MKFTKVFITSATKKLRRRALFSSFSTEIIHQICLELSYETNSGFTSQLTLKDPSDVPKKDRAIAAVCFIGSAWREEGQAQLFKKIIIRNSAHLGFVAYMPARLRGYVRELFINWNRLDAVPVLDENGEEIEIIYKDLNKYYDNADDEEEEEDEDDSWYQRRVTEGSLHHLRLLLLPNYPNSKNSKSRTLPKLKSLRIDFCNDLDFRNDIIPLLSNHPKITRLTIYSHHEITSTDSKDRNDCLHAIDLHWKNLETIQTDFDYFIFDPRAYLDPVLASLSKDELSQLIRLRIKAKSPTDLVRLLPLLKTRINGNYTIPNDLLGYKSQSPWNEGDLMTILSTAQPIAFTSTGTESSPLGRSYLEFENATRECLPLLLAIPNSSISIDETPPAEILAFLKSLKVGDLECERFELGWNTDLQREGFTTYELELIESEIVKEFVRLEINYELRKCLIIQSSPEI